MPSGYIEGYYGRQLAWSQREAIIDTLQQFGMNTYVYAPKEDRFHRRDWSVPYPREWTEKFAALLSYGRQRKVSVVPCLAPGLSFDYLSSKHLDQLFSKVDSFISMGVSQIALLMDDISEELPLNCREKYGSLGEAHGELLRKLDDHLKDRGATLWFCPTIYSDEFSKEPLSENCYLQTLSATMPAHIPLLWTGPHIVSQTLDSTTLKSIRAFFGDNIIIWDNLYANDYCPMKLIIGPYAGRSESLLTQTSGVLLNPTGLFHTDRFLLTLLGRFLSGEDAEAGWAQTASHFDLSPLVREARFLFESPFVRLGPDELSSEKRARIIEGLYRLVFDWKGPLHDEWYPFLYQAWVDLQTLDKADDSLWIAKKYPPTTGYIIKRS